MDRQQSPQDITWFLDLNKKSQIDLNPPYQRKSVWTRNDKQFFLDTIFNNYPCPSVFLHKAVNADGDVTYAVVDGKQRLQTIFEFSRDEVAIPKDFGDNRIAGKKFSQLDVDAKKIFWNYRLNVEMLPSVENSFVNDVFDRINRNARKLARQELRHARFDGWLATRAEEEAAKQEWKDFGVVTAGRSKRMSDVQFISELFFVSIRGDIAGFDQDVLDQFYADFDNPEESVPGFSIEEFDARFESVKKYLIAMNEQNGAVSKYGKTLANFYSLWSYIALVTNLTDDPKGTADRYNAFMESVMLMVETGVAPGGDELIVQYATNLRGATTDETPRRERHDAMVKKLDA